MGLTVSAPTITNTTIKLQWSDDTLGVTNYKVCFITHVTIAMMVMQIAVLKSPLRMLLVIRTIYS